MTEKHDETCENCGQIEEHHPYYWGYTVHPEPCKKFKAKNHSPLSRDNVRETREGNNKAEVTCSDGNLPEDKPSDTSKESEGTFNLSEKVIDFGVFAHKDVKEFIRRLKEELEKGIIKDAERYGYCSYCVGRFLDEIDKLAGGELR